MASTKLQKFKYNSYKEFLELREQIGGKGDPTSWRCGASTVASVLNEGSYMDSFMLFYSACEHISRPSLLKPETHRGQVQESVIYNEYWRYINPEDASFESYIDNWHGKKKIYRRAVNEKYIYFNPKYPQLYASPDFRITKNKYSKKGPLEIKCPNRRAVDKYVTGIPREYEIQIQQQMMVMEEVYGEVFMLVDTTDPELFCYEKNKEIQERIDHDTREFGALVLEGKKIVYSNMPWEEKEQALGEIAPEPTGIENVSQFLKDQHKPENAKVTVEGTSEQLEIVLEYLRAKENIKSLYDTNNVLENKIRSWFTGLIGEIQFGPGCSISYKSKLNVPKRILELVA